MNLKQFDIKKTKVLDNIYCLDFKDPLELSKTFLRFQEHYESPKYRGKIFTLKEFKAWYSEAFGGGKFTYYQDWGGFNIPSYVLKPFYNGSFKRITKRERAVLDAFKSVKEPYYVVGVSGTWALRHELTHGLFYVNETYREKVLDVLNSLDLTAFK